MTNEDGSLNAALIKSIVGQLAMLRKNHDVLLVSSGAMGAGRNILKNKPLHYDEVTSRQLYAVVGQVKLMEIYSNLFAEYGLTVAQMLATRQDFENRTHFLNTKNCIESLFREGIIPILNENDFVCVEELMFTDNDELAGMISKMLFADKFIILSNIPGVMDENGDVIGEFAHDAKMPDHIHSSDKSSFGKGGMQTKFKIAQDAAGHGTDVFISKSSEENVIVRIIDGEHVGSRFVAGESLKKPLIHSK